MIQKIKDNRLLLVNAKAEQNNNRRNLSELEQQKASIPGKIANEQSKIKVAGTVGSTMKEVEEIVHKADCEIARLKSEAHLLNQKMSFLKKNISDDVLKVAQATKNLTNSKQLFIDDLEKKITNDKKFMAVLIELKAAYKGFIASIGGGMREDSWIENICWATGDDPKLDEKMFEVFGDS